MTLQSSGAISLNDIHIEAGGSSGTQAAINDSDIRGLIGKASGAQSSFSEFYGASAASVSSISTSNWSNSGSGTSSNPWTGGSTTQGAHNSEANIYFFVSGGSLTLQVDVVISSEQSFDFGYIYNGTSTVYFSSGFDSYSNTITIADGSYLRLRYSKDVSVNDGNDRVTHSVYVT